MISFSRYRINSDEKKIQMQDNEIDWDRRSLPSSRIEINLLTDNQNILLSIQYNLNQTTRELRLKIKQGIPEELLKEIKECCEKTKFKLFRQHSDEIYFTYSKYYDDSAEKKLLIDNLMYKIEDFYISSLNPKTYLQFRKIYTCLDSFRNHLSLPKKLREAITLPLNMKFADTSFAFYNQIQIQNNNDHMNFNFMQNKGSHINNPKC